MPVVYAPTAHAVNKTCAARVRPRHALQAAQHTEYVNQKNQLHVWSSAHTMTVEPLQEAGSSAACEVVASQAAAHRLYPHSHLQTTPCTIQGAGSCTSNDNPLIP